MNARKNILVVSPAWPLGRTYGGQLRTLHTMRALEQLGDVTVMVVGSEAADTDAARISAAEFRIAAPVSAHVGPNRGSYERIRRAFDTRYMNVHGVSASAEDTRRVEHALERYDLVWVLNARTPNLLNLWRWPRGHLDIDDIPSVYPRAEAAVASFGLGRLRARTRQALLRRREQMLVHRFTTLSVCSEADRKYLALPNLHVIPNGFPRPTSEPRRNVNQDAPLFGFIGLYSYVPNRNAVQWFLANCWPLIRQAIPNAQFRVIGKGSDGPSGPTGPGVSALGWVEDPADEISKWTAMVVPIRVGGGTRIKLADAFSRKCPVVATHFGAYGYEVTDGDQLRLADDSHEFAARCVELARNPAAAAEMAERAWSAFLTKWTWDAIAPRVINAAEDCLLRSAAAAAR